MVVEPFVEGMEVSVGVIETEHSGPLALLPTEVELCDMEHLMIDADLDLQHHVDRNEVWMAQCNAFDRMSWSSALSLSPSLSLSLSLPAIQQACGGACTR